MHDDEDLEETDELEEFDDDEGYDDEEDDGPSSVFVGMTLRRDNSDSLFATIRNVCRDLELTAFRAEPNQLSGRMPLHQVVQMLVDDANFAILDLTYDRPTLGHELAICDREFASEFVLQIAKEGAPTPAAAEGRVVMTYRDAEDLRRIVQRQLNQMIDAWNEEE